MSSTRKDYLQAIYRLSKEKGYTTNKDISEYFSISRPSVSEMIKKLNTLGMLRLDKNKISLSEKGIEEAKKILSKHRIWEYFLTVNLKMDPKKVHEQADILDHITSDELRDALNKYLGYPTLSPNGNDIYENIKE
ncbi:metal-dependent transcriptional regulator [Peptoniphilus mikwangii]|uniref:metal-dependent transcriptional regulator n=1 Tax=Peptoniphilus mikwangii TaxID=1354300 RepID=UPI00055AE7B5|nr:metal-dependent transcriptional regulator [Peptoniphilus mikwangii]